MTSVNMLNTVIVQQKEPVKYIPFLKGVLLRRRH